MLLKHDTGNAAAQDLCAGCFFHLEHSSPGCPYVSLSHIPMPSLKGHFLDEDFPDHLKL